MTTIKIKWTDRRTADNSNCITQNFRPMKQILFFILTIVSINSYGQNLMALDTKFGFREMKFGDFSTKFDDLVIKECSNDSTSIFYNRTGDKLTIGSANVSIAYGFYKGYFFSVNIRTKGYEDSRVVLKTLEELYGKGYQKNEYIKEYRWNGKTVSLVYDENSINGSADILMYSKECMYQQLKDEKEKAKKAKIDF